MTIEAIDVVSDAVKIGLGALISGITTYVVLHKQSYLEKQKEFRDKKSDHLTEVIDNIEPYFYNFQMLLDLVDGALKQGVTHGPMDEETYIYWEFKEQDDQFISIRDRKNITTCRLRILSLTSVAEKLIQIVLIENHLRDQVIFKRCLPEETQFDKLCKLYYEYRNEFYSMLADEFSNTYS